MVARRNERDGEARGSGRLSAADWIEAGLAALARGGPNALRIERLAKDVGVSKGSFYWHFADRAALEEAVLDTWAELSTAAILAQVAGKEPGEVRLRRLGRLATDAGEPGALFEVERAVRAWSVLDRGVADRVESADSQRLAGVTSLFRDCGFGRADAELRARIFAYYVAGEAVSYPRLSLAKRRRLAQKRIDLLIGV